MLVEKFGLDALEVLCGGTDAVAEVLPKYEVNPPGKAAGVWLRLPSASHEFRFREMHEAEADVLEWSSHGKDDRYPALPFPFSAYDLAAFGLAGGGVFLADRFYDGPDIDETALRQLGRGKEYLRELVRQAHALEHDAYQQQRIKDGRGEDEQPRDADEAARWLGAARERLLAAERILAGSVTARAGHPHLIVDSQQTPNAGAETTPLHAADRGRRLKRATLISENRTRWESIESDLHDAAANGLTEAARDFGGFWWEGSAKAWATARGKLKGAAEAVVIHRIRG